MTRIVCISDTHSKNLVTKWEWPEGDILIHAGDFTARGSPESIKKAAREMMQLPYRYKILVPGNHDRVEGDGKEWWKLVPGIIILNNESINIEGIWFYGMAWMSYRPNTFPSEIIPIKEMCDMIPIGTDVLISHLPPFQIMDMSHDNRHLGSTELLVRVGIVEPRLHVFGHAHKDYGLETHGGIRFVNASLVDNEAHKPVNQPIVVEL